MKPALVIHRRNSISQLAGLPQGCWVEIDADARGSDVVLAHDADEQGEKLSAYLPAALKQGVTGFVIDCKRENVEKLVKPLLAQHKVQNYFFLNEMDVQADIMLGNDASHKTALRIWQYRSAADVIRYANEAKPGPGWIWVDCWRRGLLQDINKAFVPLNKADAESLQKLGMKLCICSPELYTHSYGENYIATEMSDFHDGVRNFRKQIEHAGIVADAVCTKFAEVWG